MNKKDKVVMTSKTRNDQSNGEYRSRSFTISGCMDQVLNQHHELTTQEKCLYDSATVTNQLKQAELLVLMRHDVTLANMVEMQRSIMHTQRRKSKQKWHSLDENKK